MPITKYKLEKIPNGGLTIPNHIVDGGYWQDQADGSMLGWYRYTAEYSLPDVTPLTKSQVAEHFLDMHSRNYMADDEGTPLTNTQVIAIANTWVDSMCNTNIIVPENPTETEMNDLKSFTIGQAFAAMERKLEDAYVEVFIASANTLCPFGCDKVTQDNIIGINTAIAVQIPIPNPTYWTPKGYSVPVEITHLELITVGGAILDKKNEYYQNYFVHKQAITAANNYYDIATYDYATGYA